MTTLDDTEPKRFDISNVSVLPKSSLQHRIERHHTMPNLTEAGTAGQLITRLTPGKVIGLDLLSSLTSGLEAVGA